MDINQIIEQFKKLPEWVKEIILDPKISEVNQRIITHFGLTEEQKDYLFEILRQLFFKQLSLDQLFENLKPLNLEEEKTKELAIEIAKYELLPLMDYLEVNIPDYIQKWGGIISKDEIEELLKESRKKQKELSGKSSKTVFEELSDIEEDVQEIEKIKEEITKISGENISYDQAIKNTIEQAKLSFADEILEKRFKNIALSYLKDVRDEIETRMVLKRPQKIGGLELDEAKVDEIIKILKEQKPKIKPEIKPIPEKASLAEGITTPEEMVIEPETMPTPPSPPPPPPPPPPPSPLSQIEKKEEAPPISSPPSTAEVSKSESRDLRESAIRKFETGPLVPPIPGEVEKPIEKEKIEERVVAPETLTKVAEEVAKTEVSSTPLIPEISLEAEEEKSKKDSIAPITPEALPTISETPISKIQYPESSVQISRPPTKPTRPPVEEIKITPSLGPKDETEGYAVRRPKIYSPIDELRTITLEDWRRYGKPQEAANRLLDKINLLAEESLLKKAEGIKAWKESEVSKLYLEIGNEAIETGKTVEEVIKDRIAESRPTLTLEEFNAVAELNQKLRF